MFNKVERLISSRNLKPKKKEGFLKIISIFSFVGIMLGVAILIIVMSVMNGFRTDLTNKLLGLNPHIIIEPYQANIDQKFEKELEKKIDNFNITRSYNGEGVAITQQNTKGVSLKGIDKNDFKNFKFLEKQIKDGSIKNFKKNSAIIGAELASVLGLFPGDSFSLMSSTFINTPLGKIPKQETYKVAGIFNSGFLEFDKHMIFLNIEDILSIFEKTKKDLNIEIYLESPLKADKYKEEIKKSNPDFFVYSWTDINKTFFSALKVERNVMFVILTLIIIVAAFNIVSGLTILIKNKTREIAILKTLGLGDKSIIKTFFLTGFTIGFLATVAGVSFGIIFSIYIEEIRIILSSIFNLEIFPPDVYFLDKMPSEISFLSTSIIFIFSLLTSIIASYFPAKIISNMDTTKALKYD